MPLSRTHFLTSMLSVETPNSLILHPSLRHLPRNPNQILIHQRLLLEPIHHLVQHRGRDLVHVDAGQGDDVSQHRRERIFEELPGGGDEARFRDAGFHGALVGLREGEDAVFRFALLWIEEKGFVRIRRLWAVHSAGNENPREESPGGGDKKEVRTRIRQYSAIQLGFLLWSRSEAAPLM